MRDIDEVNRKEMEFLTEKPKAIRDVKSSRKINPDTERGEKT